MHQRTISVAESRELDHRTINQIGIPSLVLMERAALKIYDNLLHESQFDLQKILVVVGPGNNGGDGLAVARLLITHDYDVTIMVVGDQAHASADNQTQAAICDHYQIPHIAVGSNLNDFTTIIDGLFGSGLTRAVTGAFLKVINQINASSANVLAIDIPSGLNGDSGVPMGQAIKADLTATLAYCKNGMNTPLSQEYTGRIVVNDIGIYFNDRFENN